MIYILESDHIKRKNTDSHTYLIMEVESTQQPKYLGDFDKGICEISDGYVSVDFKYSIKAITKYKVELCNEQLQLKGSLESRVELQPGVVLTLTWDGLHESNEYEIKYIGEKSNIYSCS